MKTSSWRWALPFLLLCFAGCECDRTVVVGLPDVLGQDGATSLADAGDASVPTAVDGGDAGTPVEDGGTRDGGSADAGPACQTGSCPVGKTCEAGVCVACTEATCPGVGRCSKDGWCWWRPLPLGNGLFGVYGFASNDVWAVGDTMIQHFDGVRWTVSYSGTHQLRAVWGAAPDDVWVAGDKVLLRWDGQTWKPFAAPPALWNQVWELHALSGRAANDIWASGYPNAVIHWDGSQWTRLTSSGLGSWVPAIWASGPNEAYAVTNAAATSGSSNIVKWTGTAWSTVHGPTDRELRAIHGSSPSNIWASGWNGILRHFDGSSWADVASGTTEDLVGLGVVSSSEAWVAGSAGAVLRWQGSAWAPVSAGSARSYSAAWIQSATEGWFVGPGGTLVRLTAGGPQVTREGGGRDLYATWASGPNDVWAGGHGEAMWHWDGSAWTEVENRFNTGTSSVQLWDLWGSAANDLWAVSTAGINHWDGSAWKKSNVTSGIFMDAHGSAADDVWAVGNAGTWRFNGVSWSQQSSTVYAAVHAFAKSNAWACNGTLDQWNGTTWTQRATLGGGHCLGLWASGPDDLWVAGYGSSANRRTLWRWNGATLEDRTPPELQSAFLRSVFGFGPNDVYVAGDDGVLAHWDGSAWTVQWAETLTWYFDLFGVGNQLWVVGLDGAILRRSR